MNVCMFRSCVIGSIDTYVTISSTFHLCDVEPSSIYAHFTGHTVLEVKVTMYF